ncbi:ArgR family transcriptional regulator [bacterium]|nr:ArgR family transcriptional regulator [bacterium]MBU1874011.1 ArgR family transcriptional regulator [bacterium]
MKEKADRQLAIREILGNSKISSQEELRSMLESRGYATTQATLSRDLSALKIIKIPDDEKGYIYTMSNEMPTTYTHLEDSSPLHTCRSIAFSHNLAIIKCLPSFAPSVALILDRIDMDIIIGTIAGDDTVLIIMAEGVSHEQFRELLVTRLPELRGRI